MSNMSKFVEVPYIASNLERCMCSQCPVQAESACALEKMGNFKNEAKNLGEGKAPCRKMFMESTVRQVKLSVET
jgi:hypothetical protein